MLANAPALGERYAAVRGGGATWNGPLPVPGAQNVLFPSEAFDNTTFTDGIENTFGVGPVKVNGHYPIYVSWEDYTAGKSNVILSGPVDGDFALAAGTILITATGKVGLHDAKSAGE